MATWLGDIRRYFPREVVAFMEKDAVERKGLRQLLMEPEVLQSLEKDVGLVATILAFKHLMPEQTRQTARQVVAAIVEDLRQRLENETRQALLGAMRRDRHSPLKVARNLDLRRTVREGLRHYQPDLKKVVPERIHFFANQRRYHEWRVIVLVDQSGSMGESVVYASIVAAVFASLPALDTRLVFFDTGIADVSDQLSDPVEILFGVQLGGGTDIARAVRYGAIAGRAAGEDAVPADHRPVRGRQRGRPAPAAWRAEGGAGAGDVRAGPERRRHGLVRPRHGAQGGESRHPDVRVHAEQAGGRRRARPARRRDQ